MFRKIVTTNKAHASRSMGPHVKQVVPSAVDNVDPFDFLDHLGPIKRQPEAQGVPPHPHAGIATITYLFEGSNRHQDSYGHDQFIHAGDLAWMRAGKGIVHAEGMNENRSEAERVHGLQFWISLPAKDKFMEPDFFYYENASLPIVNVDGASLKVIAGEFQNVVSPVISQSPAYIYEIKIPAGIELSLPIHLSYSSGVYVINGRLISDNRELFPAVMSRYDEAGTSIHLIAKEDSHLVVFGGKILDEPIVPYASFVMNSEEQIKQVVHDYQTGKMGTI